MIEINDTLQLTREQGFPAELDLEQHLKTPLSAADFAGRIFEFNDKPEIRVYQVPPVRNFLVENQNGKWIYWGWAHVVEITHDYAKRTTSGKFKIAALYPPDEMQKAYDLIGGNVNAEGSTG